MKTIDRIPFLSNVLIVACTRMNNSEVGKLVKAVVAYATDGTRPAMDDLRLETYFDLIAQDLDSLRTAAEVKSRKCSESAKCRTAKTTARPANVSKRAIDNPPASTANDSEEKSETDFNANDPTSSFERMKQIYGKTGNNESQAFDTWKLLTADERTTAFANVQRLQGDLASRSYLFVYLRDKEWNKTGVPQGGLQQ
ncbi:MAG: hypothetical protein IJ887_14650 [Prevotella sp.]|jgi:hypothetical protein|nr:hypothetical protein [Prevotella sp.]